ncbi:MAG: radical SAM protein [Spirochaetes bacterium]|nr:radical SAM protein [Spirochaetota bacterium]
MDLHSQLIEKYRALNKIHSLMIEVTHRCPCSCVHCFQVRNNENELTLAEFSDIFGQLRDEGAINIGITGGEPFARGDLAAVIESARKHGFFLSILTTGLMIGRAEADMLEKLRVYSAEISLLGATPETHDTLMNVPGAFDRMTRAVSLLRERRINVALKTTVMRQNYRELQDMKALCARLGATFQANLTVSPRLDGERTPQDFLLTGEEIAAIDPELINGGLIPGEDMKGGAVLSCNAGKNSAAISPQGDVYPCILMRKKVGSLRERSLRDIWHDSPAPFLEELRTLKPEDVADCSKCGMRAYCRRCPGVTYIETGSLTAKSPTACHCAAGIAAGIRGRSGQGD